VVGSLNQALTELLLRGTSFRDLRPGASTISVIRSSSFHEWPCINSFAHQTTVNGVYRLGAGAVVVVVVVVFLACRRARRRSTRACLVLPRRGGGHIGLRPRRRRVGQRGGRG